MLRSMETNNITNTHCKCSFRGTNPLSSVKTMLLSIHYSSCTYLCWEAQLLNREYLPSSFSFLLPDMKEGLNIACTVLTKTVTACRRLNRHIAALIWCWTSLPFPDNFFFRSKSREDMNRHMTLVCRTWQTNQGKPRPVTRKGVKDSLRA